MAIYYVNFGVNSILQKFCPCKKMTNIKYNEISYFYLSFWVSYSYSWASSFSFGVYWIKPEVGWITLWVEIFR